MLSDKDRELLEAPYRKLQKVEEQLEFNALLDLYVSLYKRKYRGEPIFPVSNSHLTAIKDFKRNAGPRAYELLQHFFEMKDDWFERQAYSLDCLNKNLHKVAASLSQRAPREGGRAKMSLSFHCDSCWKEFQLELSRTTNLNDLIRCEECERSNKEPIRLDKAQRRETVLKLGSAFKPLPEVDLESHKQELLDRIKEKS